MSRLNLHRITSSPQRRSIAIAAVSLVAAAVFVVVIVFSTRGPSVVETQGTLTPTTRTAPPRTVGTTPPPPTTEAPTTTAPPTTPAPTAAPTTAAPRRPTPSVPETSPAPASPTDVDPFHIRVDRIGVDASVVAVGVDPGTRSMQIPGLDDVGWYQFGSLPGDPTGTAVLVGHVDGNGRAGVFADLRDLAPGDTLTVTLPNGSPRTFAVTGIEQFNKQALPSDLFARGGAPRLALITCGGAFDADTGHYLDNVVVVAAAI